MIKKLLLSMALAASLLYAAPVKAIEPKYIIYFMTVHLEEFAVGDAPVIKTDTKLQEVTGDTMRESYKNCMSQLNHWASRSDSTWVFFCWPVKNPNYIDGSTT